MTQQKSKKWFKDWFNSTYYQVLYANRNEEEAKAFIDNIISYLEKDQLITQPHIATRVLDLACGKGRHSRYLAEKGFDVTGIDLSPLEISKAKKLEKENLHFFEQDMREKFREDYFSLIVNLFTSIGYFDNPEDEIKTFSNIALALKEEGIFIIDFFNAEFVKTHLVKYQEISKRGIRFKISKRIEENFILKDIEIEGNEQRFQEKVRLYKLNDFRSYLEKFDFKIISLFGDYELNPFDEEKSQRLIIVSQKCSA